MGGEQAEVSSRNSLANENHFRLMAQGFIICEEEECGYPRRELGCPGGSRRHGERWALSPATHWAKMVV